MRGASPAMIGESDANPIARLKHRVGLSSETAPDCTAGGSGGGIPPPA